MNSLPISASGPKQHVIRVIRGEASDDKDREARDALCTLINCAPGTHAAVQGQINRAEDFGSGWASMNMSFWTPAR